MTTDAQLMLAVQAESCDAFEDLYKRHDAALRAFIANRLPRGACEVDDILQATFLRLYKVRQQFISPHLVTNYLYRTALRLTQSYWRHCLAQKRDRRREEHSVTPVAAPNQTQVSQQIADLLTELTPAEAEVIRLIDLEGHTAASAADALGIPLTTVQWRRRKALQRLRALVDN